MIAALLATSLAASPTGAIPRTVIALYDSRLEPDVRFSLLHTRVELPLNHLGLVVRHRDIRQGLPDPHRDMEGVRGAVLHVGLDSIEDPERFITWANAWIDSGRKLVVLGELGVSDVKLANRVWSRLGLRSDDSFITMTYDLHVVEADPDLVGFERSIDGILPGYPVMHAAGGQSVSFLTVERTGAPETRSDLVVCGANGGFVAPGYLLYTPNEQWIQWIVNPFELFRRALGTDDLPKPDTTTLSGRRIFYSHIDGDGWRNESEIPRYRAERAIAAEVVYREVLLRFPDLPVTVAPVVGDLDPDWFGDQASLRLAREILALPQVEAGSHTYSHPLDWGSFDPARRPGPRRASRHKGGLLNVLTSLFDGASNPPSTGHFGPYERPRSYEVEPFDLTKEIDGSVRFIEALLPPGRRVRLIQWSGNTRPFAEAIARARALGLSNINGGDSRLDAEYPSYAFVAPLGFFVGEELQIYASNSNENTYTDLFTDRFFGFKHLRATVRNTEQPRRVKPFNVYYHMYSGQKLASLNAVLENLRIARESELTPVAASEYAAIAEGFFATKLVALGPSRFLVRDRGALQTLRFDDGDRLHVDWSRSRGVLGCRHHQRSLYVALDPTVDEPVVALSGAPSDETASRPFLIHARWQMSHLETERDGFRFEARGFGEGEMLFRVPVAGEYDVVAVRGERTLYRGRARTDGSLRLHLRLDHDGIEPVRVRVIRRASETGTE